jgi:hypothetical protein
MSKLDEAFQRLDAGAAALRDHAYLCRSQIRGILSGRSTLPHGCDSQEAAAAAVLRQLLKDRDEVNAALADLEKAIAEEAG